MNTNIVDDLTNTSTTENARVLVVDDNEDLLKLISIRLKPMKFDLKTVTSAEEALSVLAVWNADLVVTDLQMDGMSGMELFETLQSRNPLLPVIILTAHGSIPEAVEATQSGVASYLTKPFDSDALVKQIQLALLRSEFTSRPSSLPRNDHWRRKIISKSSLMESVLHQIERLAPTEAIVIFEGPAGTGKDELARALHARSNRFNRSLHHLSCTSLPDDLLEMELFGRIGSGEDGEAQRVGLLEQAHGGTLLLSDFDEASTPTLQRLMRALLEKKARPVDSEKDYPIDVRVLATSLLPADYSQRDEPLWSLGAKLDIAIIKVPALEDRREDIPLIITHCLNESRSTSDFQFSNKALQVMLTAAWPGNVRQLINVVKQCIRLTKTKIISEALVQSRIQSRALQVQPLSYAQREFERDYLVDVLKLTNGNVTKAANLAKRNRTEFHRLLNKHKIEAKAYRQSS